MFLHKCASLAALYKDIRRRTYHGRMGKDGARPEAQRQRQPWRRHAP